MADPAAAVARARSHPSLDGRDLVREVTAAEGYEWNEPVWPGPTTGRAPEPPPERHHVVAYDFGIKRGILRHLRSSGLRVTRVIPTPAAMSLIEARVA